MIFIPDYDFVKGISTSNIPGVSNQIGKAVTWFTKKLEQLIEAKREEIYTIRQGALTSNKPKLIWVKVIEKPTENGDETTLRQKFDHILEETLVSRKNAYILDAGSVLKYTHFDLCGKLTSSGRIAFWKEVDSKIKIFDRQEVSLKPHRIVSESRREETNRKLNKLPTPPPRKC